MVELDEEASPWHTILVSGPLDPVLQPEPFHCDNLALRWERAERDGFTEGLAHRTGFGVIDEERDGLLHFVVPLPFEAEEVQFLGIADPEIAARGVERKRMLLALGPHEEQLTLAWMEDINRNGSDDWPDAMPRETLFLANAHKGIPLHGSRELHVRYCVRGGSSWALRTNSLPRRFSDGTLQWDPALRVRVRAASSQVTPTAELFPEPDSPPPAPQTIIEDASTGGLCTIDGRSFSGTLLPCNVVTGGDADGDGVVDFAVRVNDAPEQVEIRSGRDDSILRVLTGEPGDGFGTSLAFTPDLDGDDCAELLVGAVRPDARRDVRPGYVALYSGKTGPLLKRVSGSKNGDLFGLSVHYLGDLDGNDQHGALVSTNENNVGGWGRAEVLTLPDLDQAYESLSGREQCDHFGFASCAPGDVNGDGFPDFVVGAPDENTPWWDSGGVYVYSGEDGTLLRHLTGTGHFFRLGGSLAPAGDLDEDGCADFLVTGARSTPVSGRRSTTIAALSGRTGEVLRMFPSPAYEPLRCANVVNRFDEDDRRDIAILGERKAEPVSEGGSTRTWFIVVYSGTLDGVPLLEVRSATRSDAPLFCPTPGPDVDGDGHEDLLVGMGRREGEERARLLFVPSGH